MKVRSRQTFEAIRVLPETVGHISAKVNRVSIDYDLSGNPYIRRGAITYPIGTWLILSPCEFCHSEWCIVSSMSDAEFATCYEEIK